jgi:hypothetical protein
MGKQEKGRRRMAFRRWVGLTHPAAPRNRPGGRLVDPAFLHAWAGRRSGFTGRAFPGDFTASVDLLETRVSLSNSGDATVQGPALYEITAWSTACKAMDVADASIKPLPTVKHPPRTEKGAGAFLVIKNTRNRDQSRVGSFRVVNARPCTL